MMGGVSGPIRPAAIDNGEGAVVSEACGMRSASPCPSLREHDVCPQIHEHVVVCPEPMREHVVCPDGIATESRQAVGPINDTCMSVGAEQPRAADILAADGLASGRTTEAPALGNSVLVIASQERMRR